MLLNITLSSEIFSAGKHSLTIFTITSELIINFAYMNTTMVSGTDFHCIVSVIWCEVKNKGTSSYNNYIIILLSLCSFEGAGESVANCLIVVITMTLYDICSSQKFSWEH